MKYGAPLELNEHTAQAAQKADVDFVEHTLNKEYSDGDAKELMEYGEELYRFDIQLSIVGPNWWDFGAIDETEYKRTVPDFHSRLTLATRMATRLMIIQVDNTEEREFDYQSFKELMGTAHQHSSDQMIVGIKFPWEDRNDKIYRTIDDWNTRKFMLSVDPVEFVKSDVSYKPDQLVDLMNSTIHLNYTDEWADIEDNVEFQTMKKYFSRDELYVTGEATSIQQAQNEQETIDELLAERV